MYRLKKPLVINITRGFQKLFYKINVKQRKFRRVFALYQLKQYFSILKAHLLNRLPCRKNPVRQVMYLRAVIKNGKGSLAVRQAALLQGIKNMEKQVASGR